MPVLYTSNVITWINKGDDTMRLTNATEKAIAVVAMLATQKERKLIPSSVIVGRLDISDSYTKKLLRKLVVGGIVKAVPGNNGGFCLAMDLEQINVLQVVEAIEGEIITYPGYGTLKRAFEEFPESTKDGDITIKNIFQDADKLWRNSLSKITLDMVFAETFGSRDVTVNWLDIENS